ncbi:hypothetical protein AGMMS49957_17130 [Synergistales bacterium]|nr:hypothetical protein AGMMS49957_17130 [Synergistales bacterium]
MLKEGRMEQYASCFLAAFSLALYFLIIPWQIEFVEGANPSPRSFPETIALVLFALSVCLFVSGVYKSKREEQSVYSMSAEDVKLALFTMFVMAAYTFSLYHVPYIPATIAVLALLIWFYGQRKLWKLGLTALVLPPIIYQAFAVLLKMKLP